MKYGVVSWAIAVYVGVVAEVRAAGPTCPMSAAEVQKEARRWKLDPELPKTGVGPVQAAALAKVACAMDEVIALRPVNPAAAPWILAGAPTKDMSLKPKSSEHALIEGLLPTDQRHSKGGEKYNPYVDKALRGKEITGTFNVTQVEVEVDLGGGKKGLVCARGGGLEVVDPGPALREKLRTDLAAERARPTEAALRDFEIDGDCKVVTVLALQHGGVTRPITADYDIFFLMSRADVSRGARHDDPNGELERRFGFTDDRDLELVACMNAALRRDLTAAAKRAKSGVTYPFDLVHHGPDTTNPAKDDIDFKAKSYFPALVFPACRAPVMVANKQALQQLVLDLQREKFVAPQAFTRSKADGGYGLQLDSPLAPAILVGEAIRARPREGAACEDGQVTAVSHARGEVTVRWATGGKAGKHGKLAFAAASAGCPADDPGQGGDGSPGGDDPQQPGGRKPTVFKYRVGEKLWLMYDFPTPDGSPKKCKWAEITVAEAAAEDGAPNYQIRFSGNGSWEAWSEPETHIVLWQQHCLTTGQLPGK